MKLTADPDNETANYVTNLIIQVVRNSARIIVIRLQLTS